MEVKQVIEELMAMPEADFPVASVYLDTRRLDQHQREAVRVFVHDNVRAAIKAAGRETVEGIRATLEPIEEYVSALVRQRVDEWATGLAIFSSAPRGLLKVVRTRVPFVPMRFALAPRPLLLPLVEVAMMPPMLLAAVDSEGGLLLEASSGEVNFEARIEQPFPGRHGRGGWSQRNFQRHIERIFDRNLEATAKVLVRMADAVPQAVIVLAGQPVQLPEFERFLPPRVLDRVAARIPYPSFLGQDGELRETLLCEAWARVKESLRSESLAARDIALAEAARLGLAVAGVKDALLALNEGRVHRLLVGPTFSAAGWTCARCGALGEAAHEECPYCGGALKVADLREEVVRRAVGTEAGVDFFSPDDRFPEGVELLALLRHRGKANLASTLGVGAPAEV